VEHTLIPVDLTTLQRLPTAAASDAVGVLGRCASSCMDTWQGTCFPGPADERSSARTEPG